MEYTYYLVSLGNMFAKSIKCKHMSDLDIINGRYLVTASVFDADVFETIEDASFLAEKLNGVVVEMKCRLQRTQPARN